MSGSSTPGEFDSTRVVRLSSRVRRITAPNPGTMTGPGTNCYLVGGEEIAVIDPGIDDAAHVRRIAAAGDGRIRWILVTHAHPDHSPASRPLSRLTGAPILAHAARLRGTRDRDFRPDRTLAEGDLVRGPDFTLRALHTPGHSADHLCFLLEEEGLLFAGDQVMAGVTVVIAPPDGDMVDYLDSLVRLQNEPLTAIAPAHGRVLTQPKKELRAIVAHRRGRERDVLTTLAAAAEEGMSVGALVTRIYTHVPPDLHPQAARSVQAHLLKLAAEGRVVSLAGGERWRAAS